MSQLFTFQEVSRNDGVETPSVWIIVSNCVYDVSNYLDSHPGGGELLMEWAGKDATKALSDIGHSNDAHKIMDKFKIGELIESDRNTAGKNNAKPVVAATCIASELKKKKRFSILLCR